MNSICKVVLDYFGIDYTDSFLKHQSETLTYSPTLFSILVILNKFNLKAKGIRFSNKYTLSQENLPLLCYINEKPYLVVSIMGNNVDLLSENQKREKMSKDSFFEAWNGTGLLFLENTRVNAYEPNYKQHKRKELIYNAKKLSLPLLALIVCVILLKSGMSLWYFVAIIINFLGIGIGYLLLQEQLHIPNKFADKLCSITKDSDCAKVTDSSGSSILGLFKFSEIGFAFFCVNAFCLILWPQYEPELALYAILTLPFSLWSIWYQKFKVKSWCPLCLITLFLMWAQALTLKHLNELQFHSLIWANCVVLLCIYAIFTISTNIIMSYIESNNENKSWKLKFNHLRFDDKVVASKRDTEIISINDDNCSSIVFGNPNAPIELTVFSNPYCEPCADIHEKLIYTPGDYIKVRYVMTYFSETKSIINKYIIAAYFSLGWEETWDLLTKWFYKGKKEETLFFEKLSLNINSDEVNDEFGKHRRWCEHNDLTGTPTPILNGVKIEWPYDVDDIPYLV